MLPDPVSSYEFRPDLVHYTTKFLDGLEQGVRILVAIQQPRDLDTAYPLALLYEEIRDECGPPTVVPPQPTMFQHRSYASLAPLQPPAPPTRWVSKLVEEKKAIEPHRGAAVNR